MVFVISRGKTNLYLLISSSKSEKKAVEKPDTMQVPMGCCESAAREGIWLLNKFVKVLRTTGWELRQHLDVHPLFPNIDPLKWSQTILKHFLS